MKQRKGETREDYLKRRRGHYAANPSPAVESVLQWRERNPGYKAMADLRRRYGITPTMRDTMLACRDNKCDICGRTVMRGGGKGATSAVIDHCHSAKKVRGVLCSNCNRGLGFLQDRVEVLERAIAYLRHHQTVVGVWGIAHGQPR